MTGSAAVDRSSDSRAIGILGGTFDPIHVGHLALGRVAARSLDLEHVLFVPNAVPPHKGTHVSAAEHRAAMVRLAIAEESEFVLSTIELERPGPSYAVDTVARIAERCRADGRPEPWFVLSDDAFTDLPTWREPRRILELARIAVARRRGSTRTPAAWVTMHFPGLEARVTFLDGPDVDVAASDIRGRVAQGRSIEGLVPEVVRAYIAEHHLYLASASDTTKALASSGPGKP